MRPRSSTRPTSLKRWRGRPQRAWDAARGVTIVFPRLAAVKDSDGGEMKARMKSLWDNCKETVKGFAAIVDGQCDDLPEWAFFNVGTLADARKKYADKQAEEKGGAN